MSNPVKKNRVYPVRKIRPCAIFLLGKKAFTLTEVIVTVVIFGVLAAIAIPVYRKTIEKSFGDRARTVLKTIYTAQRLYKLYNNRYDSSLNPGLADSLVGHDYLENPNAGGLKFTYTITAADATAFTAPATRNSGTNNTEFITINQAGSINDAGWTP